MNDLFDEFARAAAAPMTRSRALKVFGGAFVDATFPARCG
jgi:hypothetical protein